MPAHFYNLITSAVSSVFLKMRVSEIRVKQIRVNQGLGVLRNKTLCMFYHELVV